MKFRIYDERGTHYTLVRIEVFPDGRPYEVSGKLTFSSNKAKLACMILTWHCQPISFAFNDSLRIYTKGSEEVLSLLKVLAATKSKITYEKLLELGNVSQDLKAFRKAMATFIAEVKLLGTPPDAGVSL